MFVLACILCVLYKDAATTEIYTYGHTLSLHDALPSCHRRHNAFSRQRGFQFVQADAQSERLAEAAPTPHDPIKIARPLCEISPAEPVGLRPLCQVFPAKGVSPHPLRSVINQFAGDSLPVERMSTLIATPESAPCHRDASSVANRECGV